MRVVDILEMLAAGVSEAEIVSDFPFLSPEDVRDSIAYLLSAARENFIN